MPHYNEDTYEKVSLKPVEIEEFYRLLYDLNKDKSVKDHVHFSYSTKVLGIYYDNDIVGLINGINFIDESVALNIAILSEYRGKGIAQVATEKLVYEKGYMYSDAKKIIANISPSNESAINTIKHIGWKQTDEYNELMIEEGSEFFNIYAINNPYHLKKVYKHD